MHEYSSCCLHCTTRSGNEKDDNGELSLLWAVSFPCGVLLQCSTSCLCPRFRQELLQGSDTLNRGVSRLEQGHRTLAETEAIGNDVLLNLQKQRQQLKSAQCVTTVCGRVPESDA